jgi:hypothetical protein
MHAGVESAELRELMKKGEEREEEQQRNILLTFAFNVAPNFKRRYYDSRRLGGSLCAIGFRSPIWDGWQGLPSSTDPFYSKLRPSTGSTLYVSIPSLSYPLAILKPLLRTRLF